MLFFLQTSIIVYNLYYVLTQVYMYKKKTRKNSKINLLQKFGKQEIGYMDIQE